MLSRRILRIKAFKQLYACTITSQWDTSVALESLDLSCEATRDLYLQMLGMVAPLCAEALRRLTLLSQKRTATPQEANPNMKFALCPLSSFFQDDPDFSKLFKKKALSWDGADILMRDLYTQVSSRDYFKQYMASPGNSLAEDCDLFTRIYEEELSDCDLLRDTLEEKSIYWLEDLEYALDWCCRSFQDIARTARWNYPELYMSDMVRRRRPLSDMQSDSDFVHRLLRTAISGYGRYFAKVSSLTPDWESERLFSTDTVIIALCLAEREAFPDIPDRVSLNEWVEISKFYCTPKSRVFINGLLDRIIKEDGKRRGEE